MQGDSAWPPWGPLAAAMAPVVTAEGRASGPLPEWDAHASQGRHGGLPLRPREGPRNGRREPFSKNCEPETREAGRFRMKTARAPGTSSFFRNDRPKNEGRDRFSSKTSSRRGEKTILQCKRASPAVDVHLSLKTDLRAGRRPFRSADRP